MRITLAQTSIIPGKPFENFNKIERLISQAAESASDMIIFPELWSSGYLFPKSEMETIAAHNDECSQLLLDLSQNCGIITAGSIITRTGDHYSNTMLVTFPDDSPPLRYNKIHLFRLMREDILFQPGNRLATHPCKDFTLGAAICYDLRFPGLFTTYMQAGVSLMVVCSEWPASRINHWKTLLTTRAMENQFYIAGTNAIGKIGDITFGGSSMVVDPTGNPVIICSDNQEDLRSVDIDPMIITQAREEFPVLADRRPDIYG